MNCTNSVQSCDFKAVISFIMLSLVLKTPITQSEQRSYELVPDGKGGFKKVLKESYKLKKELDRMTDFSGSLRSTDSDDEPDFSKMTEAEKQKYFEDKAKRKAERERRRREKYGDKYDEMMEKHKK